MKVNLLSVLRIFLRKLALVLSTSRSS